MSDTVKCQMCGTPAGEPHPFRHRFVKPDEDVVFEAPKPKEQPQVQKVQLPTPAEAMLIGLLQVLSKKGVLDGDDLARILTGDPGRADHGNSEP